jgi:hypothetical protein
LWEEAGRPHGYDLEHWLRAEKELLLNSAAAAPLIEEAKQELAGGEPEMKPDKKTKTENSAPKTPRKPSARSKSK